MELHQRLFGHVCILIFGLLAAPGATSFILSVKPSKHSILRDTWEGATNGSGGRIEQIEYKIYADGRVEETVRGIKGNNCEKVTETINSQLGEVVATRPTEEMFEQEVKVDQTLYETDWNGGSSW